MTYDEWEIKQAFSGVSPEASTAEAAWNAAIEEARQICISAVRNSETRAEAMSDISSKLGALDTGTGSTY